MREPKLYEVLFEPDQVSVQVPAGTPLMKAAIAAGLPLEQPCGGLGQCGQCRVEVVRGRTDPHPDDERTLTYHQLRDGIRLACRLKVDRDLTVVLGDQVRSRSNQILVGGEVRHTQVDSGVERQVVLLGKAPLTDERDDWTRLEEAADRRLVPTLPALRALPEALRGDDEQLTVSLVDGRCVRVDRGFHAGAPVGFAVDIGTTTVVLYLLDLETGAELGHAAMLNPQVAYGDDVIARIHHVSVEPHGLDTLSREIHRGIDHLLREACHDAGVEVSRVLRGTVVGNATMTHIFAGISPQGLGLAPFAPITHESVTAPGSEFGLRVVPWAQVTVLPNIAGFLGSDTVAVVLATMPAPHETLLAVDIGTNGEMVLCHQGRWYGCSAAAGPAFEGARIGCGMRGAAGAISRADLVDGVVKLAVVDNERPRGLCGSGLLDLVAMLLDAGALDITGRLAEPDRAPAALAGRISGDGPERRFEMVAAGDSATGEPLYLTAGDIREVQLAKGSIRASIETLLAKAGVGYGDVDHVYLAGGFGSYLRVPSAIRIGLLPPFDPAKVSAVGNAAGAGARLALISRAELAAAETLARAVEVLYLPSEAVYQMQFMEQMMFP